MWKQEWRSTHPLLPSLHAIVSPRRTLIFSQKNLRRGRDESNRGESTNGAVEGRARGMVPQWIRSGKQHNLESELATFALSDQKQACPVHHKGTNPPQTVSPVAVRARSERRRRREHMQRKLDRGWRQKVEEVRDHGITSG